MGDKEKIKEFETGAHRTSLEERYDLISPEGLRRLSLIYAEGAEKWGERNWEKGMPNSETLNHAARHLFKYLSGDRSVDHLAKVAWGMFTAMHMEKTHPELVNTPLCVDKTEERGMNWKAVDSGGGVGAVIDAMMDVAQDIELEILGCSLKDLKRDDRHRILSGKGVAAYRQENLIGPDMNFEPERYRERITNLFKITSGSFDWCTVRKKLDEYSEREELKAVDREEAGDPLDLDFMEVAEELNALQMRKGQTYGDSWRKRGATGVYQNMGRKWDRGENVMKRFNYDGEDAIANFGVGEEGLVESWADNAVYHIKMLTYIRKFFPKIWEDWKRRNNE
jgi:hypothetical protein